MSWGIRRCAALVGLSLTLWTATASADEIAWRSDLRTAWSEAQEQHRPLLVFITRDDCPYCTKMKQSTYLDAHIVERVDEGFIPVVVDSAVEEKFVHDLKVSAFPTTVLISPDAKILDRIKGFVEPEKFDARLVAAERRLAAVARKNAPTTDQPTESR